MLYKKAFQAALVICLCLIICFIANYFHIDVNLYFMGIGALVTISANNKIGFKQGIERIIGCISGAIIGLICLIVYRLYQVEILLVLYVFISIFLLVIINGKIKNESGSIEAIIVFTTLLSTAQDQTRFNCLYHLT